MAITLDGTTGITAPGVTDTGNLSVTGTSTLTGAVTQTSSSTAASFIPTGSTVPANGMYLSAANTLDFATNTTNQVSISSGGIVTGTAGNLMLVQNASRITLASTATVISTTIPSWVKRIVLNIVGMTTNGTSGYIVQIGSGSYTSTGYLGSGSVVATSGATTAFTTGFGMHNNNGATTVNHVTMTLNLQNAATNTWSESHTGAYSNLAVTMFGGGSVSLGGVLNQLRITTVNGTDTFTAGTINFQYE